MQYNSNQIKNAIRDFEDAAEDLLSSSPQTVDSNIDRFMDISKNNPVINQIVAPLLHPELDLNQIFKGNGFFINQITLPRERSGKISAILQLLDQSTRKKLRIDDFALRIYKHRSYADNINDFLDELVRPTIRDLFNEIHEMYEDNVKGKGEAILPASLQIFNYGTITAHQGANVALGHNITQTANYTGIADRIMQQVKESQDIPSGKHSEIEEVSQEIEEELKNNEPDKGKLRGFVSKLYDIGQKGLLKITTDVINDPRWTQEISGFLLNLI